MTEAVDSKTAVDAKPAADAMSSTPAFKEPQERIVVTEHALVIGGKKTVLRLIPSGALHPGVARASVTGPRGVLTARTTWGGVLLSAELRNDKALFFTDD